MGNEAAVDKSRVSARPAMRGQGCANPVRDRIEVRDAYC
jgi:hypothetical protein